MCVTEDKILVNLEFRVRLLTFPLEQIEHTIKKTKAVLTEKIRFERTKRDTFNVHYFSSSYRSSFFLLFQLEIDESFDTDNCLKIAMIDGLLKYKNKYSKNDIADNFWADHSQKSIEDCMWIAGDLTTDEYYRILSNFM